MTPPHLSDIAPVLLALGTRRVLPAGHTLIEQGDFDQCFYYLLEGAVVVVRDGREVVTLHAGDVVGEYAFLDNRPRCASVRTVRDSVLIELPRQEVLQEAVPSQGFLAQLLTILSERKHRREAAWQSELDARAYVETLLARALRHRAVQHPYLKALATGDLPNLRWALADFARQYYGYSAHFPRYLAQTISQLDEPSHRAALLENMTEESGQYGASELDELAAVGIDPAWIVGVPHPQLFHRFCMVLGVDHGEPTEDILTVTSWREMFLDVLGSGAAQAIGALGLGTEAIVSTMYQNFLPALERLDIPKRDAVFFPLHALVDDHHQATLTEIAVSLARSSEGRRDLEKGMYKALFLRAGFWDWMLERARTPPVGAVT